MKPISEISKLMAELVLKAAERNQMSYDVVASAAASEADEKRRAEFEAANPGRIYCGGVDYSKFYKIKLDEACEQVATEAGHPALGRMIYLAFYWWNDVIEWANAVTDPTATTEPSAVNCQHGVLYNHTLPCVDDTKPEDKGEHCPLCVANWERCKHNHYKAEEV